MMFINNDGIPTTEISLNIVFQIIYVPNKLQPSINTDNKHKDIFPSCNKLLNLTP